MSWDDPIVEEVRRNREALLEEHGGLAGLIEYLKKQENEHTERIVTKEQLKSLEKNIENV